MEVKLCLERVPQFAAAVTNQHEDCGPLPGFSLVLVDAAAHVL